LRFNLPIKTNKKELYRSRNMFKTWLITLVNKLYYNYFFLEICNSHAKVSGMHVKAIHMSFSREFHVKR